MGVTAQKSGLLRDCLSLLREAMSLGLLVPVALGTSLCYAPLPLDLHRLGT